ncbi:MAG: hypothetical protein R2867_01310 [Caldilineaceae bacterium]
MAFASNTNQVVSQVLDNLNKAALQGFTIDEAYARLELAVPTGEQRTARLNALQAARRISHELRALCQEKTLLDYSLQIELFMRQVLTNEWSRVHLFRSHRHIVFDNVEEDTASAHQLLLQWLPQLDSALLCADTDAGFRIFLGADPQGIPKLRAACNAYLFLEESHIMQPALLQLTQRVEQTLNIRRATPNMGLPTDEGTPFDESVLTAAPIPVPATVRAADAAAEGENGPSTQATISPAFVVPTVGFRFFPQMIDWTVGEIRRLVTEEAVPPGEIAILAPFVSDAMRFSLQTRLTEVGIVSTTHRPSRALDAEPAARTLLTLAKLAHPHWGMRPAAADVTLALSLTITGLDPVRAHLLSRIIYPERRPTIELGRFGELVTEMQERITYTLGEAYDRLREWLYTYRANPDLVPLDQFFARLFGELLSQPGFGFHDDRDAARIANQLVDSARNFRWALENVAEAGGADRSAFRVWGGNMWGWWSKVRWGLSMPGLATDWKLFLCTGLYLFDAQQTLPSVWLDIGSNGWWERLYQPRQPTYIALATVAGPAAWVIWQNSPNGRRPCTSSWLIRRTKTTIYLGISDWREWL